MNKNEYGIIITGLESVSDVELQDNHVYLVKDNNDSLGYLFVDTSGDVFMVVDENKYFYGYSSEDDFRNEWSLVEDITNKVNFKFP